MCIIVTYTKNIRVNNVVNNCLREKKLSYKKHNIRQIKIIAGTSIIMEQNKK